MVLGGIGAVIELNNVAAEKTYTGLVGSYRGLFGRLVLCTPDQQPNNGYDIGFSLCRLRALRDG